MLPLFAAAAFLGAALLFAIEPLAARQALPLFGGSPAVWNACVMFFQVELLAGYVYAHLLTSRLAWRWQLAMHAVVLAAAALVPVGLPTDADAAGGDVWTLLLLLVQGVGLPFFAVASAGPLLQRWFARTTHRAAADPYFLYAASNAGSFVGLLAYPFVIERVWSLGEQAAWWRGAFLGFVALSVLAGILARGRRDGTGGAAPPIGGATSVEGALAEHPWRDRAAWAFLAFVPSSLMLGVTQYISTDVAAVPLLWVVPLGLYLLTFVVAFSRAGERTTRLASRVWPMVAVGVVVAFLMNARQPLVPILVLHLTVLAVAGTLCHGRLHASRPPVQRLTAFYVCIAVGGALGGVFNTLVAPLVFNDLHEYPLAIGLACLAMPAPDSPLRGPRRLFWLAPLGLAAWVFVVSRVPPDTQVYELDVLLAAGLPALALYLTSRRRAMFAVATVAVLAAGIVGGRRSIVEFEERTFFGVHSVSVDPDAKLRVLSHGTTVHGVESLDPRFRGEPLAYYSRPGPAGSVFAARGEGLDRVAFIGLGAGSLAAYGRPGQQFDFFEIDPGVVRIASNPAWFSFLADSPAETRVVLGDGRLTLAREPDGAYDMIVLDAFSSDAIPIHLLTREAAEMYVRKLAPGGLLLLHLSNRHLDLGPLAGAACAAAGLETMARTDLQSAEDQADTGRFASTWMLAARDRAAFGVLASDVRWEPVEPARRPWTDDRADIVEALRGAE